MKSPFCYHYLGRLSYWRDRSVLPETFLARWFYIPGSVMWMIRWSPGELIEQWLHYHRKAATIRHFVWRQWGQDDISIHLNFPPMPSVHSSDYLSQLKGNHLAFATTALVSHTKKKKVVLVYLHAQLNPRSFRPGAPNSIHHDATSATFFFFFFWKHCIVLESIVRKIWDRNWGNTCASIESTEKCCVCPWTTVGRS